MFCVIVYLALLMALLQNLNKFANCYCFINLIHGGLSIADTMLCDFFYKGPKREASNNYLILMKYELAS